MIMIIGPTGCGKTSLMEYLVEHHHLTPITTYTTREKREYDKYTECISEIEFEELYEKDELVATAQFETVLGVKQYGLKLEDIVKNGVVVVCEEYVEPLKVAYEDSVLVYLDVDENSIIENLNIDERGATAKDTIDRLERERVRMNHIMDKADVVINNHNFRLSVPELASIVTYIAGIE